MGSSTGATAAARARLCARGGGGGGRGCWGAVGGGGGARAPIIVWARAFESAPQTYTAAAYIQNNNPGAGARQVSYSFQLFDADNALVVERGGTVDLPPVPTIPIIETGINVGYRSVA